VFQLEDGGRRVAGSGQPITPEEIEVHRPDMTRDGRKLLVLATFPGDADRGELREVTLAEGGARVLRALRGDLIFTPRFSRDGSRIAYRYSPSEHPMRRSIRVMDLEALREWPLTSPVDGISDNPSDWSADGRYVLASGGRYRAGQNAIAFVPLAGAPTAERQARIVTSDRERALWQPMLSPNGRWIAFEAIPVRDARATTLHVVAAEGGPWVAITDGTGFDVKPRWSDDGRLLYFLSSRGGVPNVWAAPVDPDTGRPSGAPFQLTRFDGRTQIAVPHVALAELAVGGGRIALPMADPSGSIWMLDPGS
jgi:Tol biopolymer transport system component